MTIISSAVFTLVDEIAAASTMSEVMGAYLGAAVEVGLPYAAASYYPPDPTALNVIYDALPPGWMQTYHDQKLVTGDLLTARARASDFSFAWTLGDWDIAGMTLSQMRWRDHMLHAGMLGGLVMLDFRRGENMVLLVCGPGGYLNTHDRLALQFAGLEAMLRLREMAMPDYAPLSRRERECLQWLCAGKTDREIGPILSLSEKTVNVYIERAKAKFNVATRAQIVVRAVRAGLIAA
jgi:DNA-binding CsgD family transcriptional regulator